MRIVLDAMGSDDCPGPEVQAAIQAARQFGDPIILVGPADRLKPMLAESGHDADRVHLVDAPDTITMEDKGLKLALKAKRRGSKTSMAVGMDLVLNGEADVFVTAGNTGEALATAYYRLGTIPGVERPRSPACSRSEAAFAPSWISVQTPNASPFICYNLPSWVRYTSAGCAASLRPRVGLLSNGEEGGKGNELVKSPREWPTSPAPSWGRPWRRLPRET